MNVLIADDEPIARQVLRELLAECAGVEVVGEAATGLEAAEQCRRSKPDVVFLDLQMPELDGFAVARGLQGANLPLIVFVTAFSDHALEAFDVGAVDYLLKPVRADRLAAAVEKLRVQLTGLRKTRVDVPPEPVRKIVGKRGARYHLFNPADVIAFQADREIVFLLTTNGRYYAEHSLKELEGTLPQPPFRRVHRRTIINTDHIRSISPLSSRRWLLTMSDGMEVVVSKRMTGAIREATRW